MHPKKVIKTLTRYVVVVAVVVVIAVAATGWGCANRPTTQPVCDDDCSPTVTSDRKQVRDTEPQVIIAAIQRYGVHQFVWALPKVADPAARLHTLPAIAIPSFEDMARDGFYYALVVDQSSRQYWLRITGSIAGITTYRGPFTIDDLPDDPAGN